MGVAARVAPSNSVGRQDYPFSNRRQHSREAQEGTHLQPLRLARQQLTRPSASLLLWPLPVSSRRHSSCCCRCHRPCHRPYRRHRHPLCDSKRRLGWGPDSGARRRPPTFAESADESKLGPKPSTISGPSGLQHATSPELLLCLQSELPLPLDEKVQATSKHALCVAASKCFSSKLSVSVARAGGWCVLSKHGRELRKLLLLLLLPRQPIRSRSWIS
mmetsp:Transcript_13380/g.29241  ORF Transcript_13380/g.29241 Transcript_13380/m.29241 type:complete len:217 (+) Transcript_13380:2853-3503(+)